MTNTKKPLFHTYMVVSTLVFATIATLTSLAAADQKTAPGKNQDRHPDIAAIESDEGVRHDMVSTISADGTRNIIIALPDGRYLIQRYYPSGVSIIVKPESTNPNTVASKSPRIGNS